MQKSANCSRLASGQQVGAHHGRCRQRDDKRDHDGQGQRHRKFAEDAEDDAAHQEEGQEHRDQGDANGKYGEADLPGALDGRHQARHAGFHMARDIFQHDNGVIDDEIRWPR